MKQAVLFTFDKKSPVQEYPFWWRIPWPREDVVTLECGHTIRIWVDRIEQGVFPDCPYKEFGACK